jgi:hypothetical protein
VTQFVTPRTWAEVDGPPPPPAAPSPAPILIPVCVPGWLKECPPVEYVHWQSRFPYHRGGDGVDYHVPVARNAVRFSRMLTSRVWGTFSEVITFERLKWLEDLCDHKVSPLARDLIAALATQYGTAYRAWLKAKSSI